MEWDKSKITTKKHIVNWKILLTLFSYPHYHWLKAIWSYFSSHCPLTLISWPLGENFEYIIFFLSSWCMNNWNITIFLLVSLSCLDCIGVGLTLPWHIYNPTSHRILKHPFFLFSCYNNELSCTSVRIKNLII